MSVSAITNEMQQMHVAFNEVAEELNSDEVAIIFSFLPHSDIMRARICTTWRDAAKKTLVPLTNFKVDSVRSYNAMRVMSIALPNLQQLTISNLRGRHKYIDGEDPDERLAAWTADCTSHDVNIISGFRKLRVMLIRDANLNGRYHSLFNFPLLQRLSISDCRILKYDLDMIASLPSLKEMELCHNPHLTGNLTSLRALKDSLESVIIGWCSIEGDFMDLADLPRLRKMDLLRTDVTGDIRNIHEDDFPAMESLRLPMGVVGGDCYEFQLISDVPKFMHTIHTLQQRTPTLFDPNLLLDAFDWTLSEDSPDSYDWEDDSHPAPPFSLQFIQVGPRLGWIWCSNIDSYIVQHSCEINWLDQEPSSSSDNCDYETYVEEHRSLEERVDFQFYRGYHQPPSEHEYRRMCEEHLLW